ncbi:HAD family hydrolase [Aspergillus stella-maris]|uniref:HAD family hydrolase n=1 Tax=Aspergillus stella-maris TaxID=1810926 RepID=UPI003CCD4451
MPLRDALRATCKDITTVSVGSSSADFTRIAHGTTIQDMLTIPYTPPADLVRKSKYKLVVFDFDTALVDTASALGDAVIASLGEVFPNRKIDLYTLDQLVEEGCRVEEIIKKIMSTPKAQPVDEDGIDYSRYADPEPTTDDVLQISRSKYSVQAANLQGPCPGAKDLLSALKGRGIPTALVSNHMPISVIFEAMDKFGLAEFMRGDLIVGEEECSLPAENVYTEVLLPRLGNIYGDEWKKQDRGVLVIGSSKVDVMFARGIGAKLVGCLERSQSEAMKADFMVSRLIDILGVVDEAM